MRLRRSLLITPGHRYERLVKAALLPADGLIFDIEDGVPKDRKSEARESIARAVTEIHFGHRERIVRVNGIGTPALEADLANLPLDRLDALMIPKVEDSASLITLETALARGEAACGRSTPIPLILTIETPRGLLRGLEIVDATRRCSGIFFGPGDYTMQTGGRMNAEGLAFPRAMIAAIAGAGQCDALDAPYLIDITDAAATKADAEIAKTLGFAGKIVFHPRQIEAANAVFSPNPAELARARKIVDGYASSMEKGEAVALIDGEFVAMDLVPRMQQMLDMAAEIARRG